MVMVRIAAALVAAMLFGSCAGGVGAAARAGAPAARDENDDEMSVAESFDPPLTAREYELSEDLRENDAGAPRFVAGSRAPRRAVGRLAFSGGAGAGNASDNEYVSIDDARFRLRARRKGSEDVSFPSLYGSARIGGDRLVVHAGNFVPDFGGGLSAGGSRSPYAFSSAFPLPEPRGIAPGTSFYGRSIAGGAIAARIGRLRATTLAGRERAEKSGKIRLTERRWAGGALETAFGGVHAGAWALGCPGEASAPAIGAGARSKAGPGFFQVEWAWRRGSSPGALAAAALRLSSTRMGAIAYALGAGGGGAFARVCGGDLTAASSHAGAAASIERRLPRRAAARLAAEWRARTLDDEERARARLRGEIEKRWRGGGLTVVWSLSRESDERLVPIPGTGGSSREAARAVGAAATIPLPHGIALRASAKKLAERPGGDGILVSLLSRIPCLSGKARVALFCSRYVASGGAPSCPIYEPSLTSVYPWTYLASGAARYGVIITFKVNMLELSSKASWDAGDGFEWHAQAACSPWRAPRAAGRPARKAPGRDQRSIENPATAAERIPFWNH